jgi:hypothetical protein
VKKDQNWRKIHHLPVVVLRHHFTKAGIQPFSITIGDVTPKKGFLPFTGANRVLKHSFTTAQRKMFLYRIHRRLAEPVELVKHKNKDSCQF